MIDFSYANYAWEQAAALLSIGFFLVVLVLGLAYAWRKGDLEWK